MTRRALLALAALLPLACAAPRAQRRPPPPAAEPARPPAPVPEPPPPARPEPEAPAREAETGVASFYAHRFHGRLTASGVRYDMHAMTCAHPTLPFGTRLKVTELESGRSVVVVVNDRGPFARGRIVDVSLEAAKRLGMVKRGVARVTVERLD